MVLISVTRLRLRSLRFLPGFIWYAIRSQAQAKRAAGNLRSSVRAQKSLVFWTLTAWDSEATMYAYMKAGAHREAMTKLSKWCDEGSVVHWHQDSADLPNWNEAEQRMAAEGKFTPLKYPSQAHREKRFSLKN